ncbi:phosphopantetheine-binding protein [Aurantiacibacter sp. MUD11]|uniref:acyl carrier protein n=1 Tax=Aurantiacibacter sp. MUD11 TaxID=3003265 RepID=UPI0022AA4CDC|nr:phosphopantetheine-binding protein [Aurantiacibacter sp. MUD11]WAT18508.1 phosphopantetheine-binding protein [Aurantiacibacter sp. MUD11]
MATNLPALSEQAGETDLVLRQVLSDVLGLSAERLAELDDDAGLFGHLPELDSMAVAGLLTELEDRLDILIEDDEVDGEMLETYGGLLSFLADKRNNA